MGSRILCSNVLRSVAVFSEVTISGFPFANAVSGTSALQAGFASGADREIIYDFGEQITIDTIGIAKHNLFAQNSEVELYSGVSTSGAWTLEQTLDPTSDNVQFSTFSNISTQYLKITIKNPTGDVYIGNISLGQSVQISDGQYVGFTQPNFASTHDLVANVTRGGEIAGIIRRPKPVKIKIQAKHLSKSWLDSNWPDLNDCITRYPFYFAWEDGGDPIYCWAKDIKSPTWNSISKLSFSINAEGFL